MGGLVLAMIAGHGGGSSGHARVATSNGAVHVCIGRAHEMPDFAGLVDEEITLLMGHDQPPHVRAYGKRMRRLWRDCVRRALHEPRADGIAASCIVRRDTPHSQ